MPETELSILVRLRDEASSQIKQMNDAIGQADKQWKDNFGNIAQASREVGIAMTAMGASITGVLALCVKAAEDDRVATEGLIQTLNNVGIEYSTVSKDIKSVIEAQSQITNYSQGEATSALQQLIGFTKNYDTAIQALPVAMDLAAYKHIDLSSAVKLVANAMDGQSTRLESMTGITIPDHVKGLAALAAIEETVGGSAQAMASPLTILKNNFSELASTVGTALLPVIKAFVDAVVRIINWVGDWITSHQQLAEAIIKVVAGLGLFMTILGPILIILPSVFQFLNMIGVIALPAFAAGAAAVGGALVPLSIGITALNTALLGLAVNPAFWAIMGVAAVGAVGLAGFGIGSAIGSGKSSSGGSGGGGDVYNITVNNAGSVITENDLIASIQQGLLAAKDRNYNTGF